jgi:hypothetical protein
MLQAREYPLSPEPVDSLMTLLDAIQRKRYKEKLIKGRFELKTHSESITNRLGFGCVEYEMTMLDNGGSATQYSKLVINVHSLICVHPESPRRIIEINYSSRNATGEIPLAAQQEGDSFINSLQALSLAE